MMDRKYEEDLIAAGHGKLVEKYHAAERNRESDQEEQRRNEEMELLNVSPADYVRERNKQSRAR
jgi:hypothetical protein